MSNIIKTMSNLVINLTGDERLTNNYRLLKDLGEGTFGKVRLGQSNINHQYVAVKILEKKRIKDQSDMLRIKLEIKILKSSKHPNIIELYEIIETEEYIYLIMEYASGGELFDYIVSKNKLSERESSVFLK